MRFLGIGQGYVPFTALLYDSLLLSFMDLLLQALPFFDVLLELPVRADARELLVFRIVVGVPLHMNGLLIVFSHLAG